MPNQSSQRFQPLDTNSAGLSDPAENLYLLLNPLGDCKPEHPLSLSSLSNALGREAIVRVPRADLSSPRLFPALVQFPVNDDSASAFLALTAAYAAREMAARKQYVCGWLTSEQPAEVTAQHIARQCHVLRPAGNGTLAPWFEPLRIALLRAVMGNAGEVLGPIRTWFYPEVGGGLVKFEGRPSVGELKVPEVARQAQRWAPQIKHFLEAWRALNTSVKAYSPWRWSGPSGLPGQASTHAWNLMHDAYQRGLSNPADIHCLNLHRVMVHPLLLHHPTIQQDVAQAVAGNQPLTARFAGYDDQVWSRIVAALPQARRYS